MVAIVKGQSAGKTEPVVGVLPAPSISDEALRAAIGSHCRQVSAALGLPRALLGREQYLGAVFPAAAVPSFHVLGGRMELGDIAAMDAVEGRAPFAYTPTARFVP